MDGSLLKKTVSAIINQLETARDQEVEVIDVDASRTNFVDSPATPEIPSLRRAADEAVAAPVARPTVACESSTPTGTSTEEVVGPNPVKQKLSNPALICFSTFHHSC